MFIGSDGRACLGPSWEAGRLHRAAGKSSLSPPPSLGWSREPNRTPAPTSQPPPMFNNHCLAVLLTEESILDSPTQAEKTPEQPQT